MSVIRTAKRRWFQYSLRTLLLLVLLACIGTSYTAVRIDRAKQEREASEAIERVGGLVQYDYQPAQGPFQVQPPPGPAWARKLLGENFFAHVVGVNLEPFARASLVTDRDMEPLEKLRQLRSLDLAGCRRVTGAGLAHIEGLRGLEDLSLTNTAIADAGLVHLHRLSRLRRLNLCGTAVTDAGLEYLQGLAQLEELCLMGTRTTDAGLEYLQGQTHLTTLILSYTGVTDVGLCHLKSLPQLRDLWLDGTGVTDAGVDYLQGLTRLRTVWVRGTHVSDGCVERFKERRPECQIGN